MESKLKTGDTCVMHTCGESTFPEYKGKVWTCKTDSYIDKAGQEVVFLEGFSGCFICEYLEPVNNSTLIAEHNLMREALERIKNNHSESYSQDIAHNTLNKIGLKVNITTEEI